MVFILNLETSTAVCSVSVFGDGKLLSLREQFDAKSHASQIIPFISEVIDESGIKPNELSAIAVSKGPGSYTGLRIGVSTAKGIAYALNIPIIAIDTLYCMAYGYLQEYPEYQNIENVMFCPMIDARRMEVYSSIYSTKLELLRVTKAEIIQNDSFHNLLNENKIHFFGDGAVKCNNLIKNENAFFREGFYPSAKYLGKISIRNFMENHFEDLAYFEPFYLKDFVATVPGNKLL